MAKRFRDSGSPLYKLLDDLPSQTGVCLNNGRRWKIAEKQVSLFVLQYKGISLPLECQNHWEALIVEEASLSQCVLSIRDFSLSLSMTAMLKGSVLLFESKLSESIVVVIGMERKASVHENVQSLQSSFCR